MRGAAAGSCYSWLLLGMAFVRFWCFVCGVDFHGETESERESSSTLALICLVECGCELA